MATVTVRHDSYGCESGCCGHVVEIHGNDADATRLYEKLRRVNARGWTFDHPYDPDLSDEEWARQLVGELLGTEAIPLLDLAESEISDC